MYHINKYTLSITVHKTHISLNLAYSNNQTKLLQ